jgi:hypothetical protein
MTAFTGLLLLALSCSASASHAGPAAVTKSSSHSTKFSNGGPRSMSAQAQRQQPGPLQPRGQLRAPSGEHVWDVTQFGAVGDNATDNTAAFAKALDTAHAAHGGMVYVPPGLYVLEGALTVPPGVQLTGSYRVVPSHDLRAREPLTDGTVLIPVGGRGSIGCAPDPESEEPDLDCQEAFITVAENGLVQVIRPKYNLNFTGLTQNLGQL